MAHLACKCGHRINLAEVPNSAGVYPVAECAIETLIASAARSIKPTMSTDEIESILYDTFFIQAFSRANMYECIKCGRLLVFAPTSARIVTAWYSVDEPASERLMTLLAPGTEALSDDSQQRGPSGV